MPLNAISDPPSSAETTWRIQPQGDRCLIVSFGDQIDAAVGRTCLAAARKLRDAGLPGVTDVVPSFVAVAVHYRPDGLGNGPTYASLADRIEPLLAEGIAADAAGGVGSNAFGQQGFNAVGQAGVGGAVAQAVGPVVDCHRHERGHDVGHARQAGIAQLARRGQTGASDSGVDLVAERDDQAAVTLGLDAPGGFGRRRWV